MADLAQIMVSGSKICPDGLLKKKGTPTHHILQAVAQKCAEGPEVSDVEKRRAIVLISLGARKFLMTVGFFNLLT